MNKMILILAVLSLSMVLCTVQGSFAQQTAGPPLLMQQTPAPPGPPGPPPGPPPPNAGPPPPPPGPGIGVWQTIPAKTLLENVKKAVTTAEAVRSKLTPGKVWTMRAPRGETEIKAALLYQGVAVGVLHFSPVDGTLLPKGIPPHSFQCNVQLNTVKSGLRRIMKDLKVLPAAEFRAPEACWVFPVAVGDTIVADLKIYYDGIHVMQDFPANQEMTLYGM